MDLVADMLARHLPAASPYGVKVLRPRYRRAPVIGRSPHGRNAERLVNRFGVYPWFLRSHRKHALYHIVDHSYSHLSLSVPRGRAIIHCHDVDAFRSVIEPAADPRPYWFRRMAAHLLRGFKEAAHIICVSETTRQELVTHGVAGHERTTVIHNGLCEEFLRAPRPGDQRAAHDLLGPHQGHRYLINVGSTIPRKRIPLLLEIFAAARRSDPSLRLVRVGGDFTGPQRALAESLGVMPYITMLSAVPTPTLAALYAGAVAAIQPTSSEGFGLPVAEAMASACPVITTDLPVLREISGGAAIFVDSPDPDSWVAALERVSADPMRARVTAAGLQRSRLLTWDAAARQIVNVYRSYFDGPGTRSAASSPAL